MNLELITPPVSTAISLDESKKYLRIEQDIEDSLILMFIDSATQILEEYLNRSIMAQTWKLSLDSFPYSDINLYYSPVVDVDSIKYTLDDNSIEIIDPTIYSVIDNYSFSKIRLNNYDNWPDDKLISGNGVNIEYNTGYTLVPSNIKNGLLMILSGLYEKREDGIILTDDIKTIVDSEKVFTL